MGDLEDPQEVLKRRDQVWEVHRPGFERLPERLEVGPREVAPLGQHPPVVVMAEEARGKVKAFR